MIVFNRTPTPSSPAPCKSVVHTVGNETQTGEGDFFPRVYIIAPVLLVPL
jgi:hypothetical protein